MRISVVIPTHNCAAYLRQAIRSVLDQLQPPDEIIVVDDGSTDETPEVLREFGDQIIVVRTAHRGVASARNSAIHRVTGDWVSFLDADDAWYPEKLQLQKMVAERYPRVIAMCSDFGLASESGLMQAERYVKQKYRVFQAYGVDWSEIFEVRDELTFGDGSVDLCHGDVFRWLFRGNFINTSSLLVRRDVLQSAGYFSSGLRTQEDYQLWLKIARCGSLAYIDRPLLFFRKRPLQLTSDSQRLRVALDTLEVVRRLAPDVQRHVGEQVVRDRLRQLHSKLALAYLGSRCHAAARQEVAQAVALHGLSLQLVCLWVWTWLPSWSADHVRWFYRVLRPGSRSANKPDAPRSGPPFFDAV